MLEWLKTVLGDAYTPEIDTAVSQEIGKGFVALHRLQHKDCQGHRSWKPRSSSSVRVSRPVTLSSPS